MQCYSSLAEITEDSGELTAPVFRVADICCSVRFIFVYCS